MKIAIIGMGIAGLGAAYLLHPQHEITVYEANAYPGGHSRTIEIPDGDRKIAVDTGFIVFNKKNYPLLTRLFDQLGVPVIPSDMSFGASIKDGWMEYGSKGMFAQKANWIRPRYWGMIRDILAFNRRALAFVGEREDITLRDCLEGMGMGEWFSRYYLLAMGAAIWSCSTETILDFPARSFLQFFDNHGLLTVNDHPRWYTVKGGSREYVTRLAASFKNRIKLQCSATKIRRQHNGVTVADSADTETVYDHVVLACHADEALRLHEEPTVAEREILSAFHYQNNRAVVHSDTSFMPRNKKCWASWVYLSQEMQDRKPVVALSYWMNNLQNLKTQKSVFITLNPGRPPASHLIYDDHVFSHPVFTLKTLHAQKRIKEIQNKDGISYCGAYQRYGFHEDGFMSAVDVARNFGINFP